jgi:8-oxo-dGTP diphosphatase
MLQHREILKIGVAVRDGDRLLVVKKKGGSLYILPGGKPEPGEDDLEALSRELDEELGCRLDTTTIEFLGSFSDTAADLHNTTVIVRLYGARLIGNPVPRSEIENLKWFSPSEDNMNSLAPSLQNKIVPFLFRVGHPSNSIEANLTSAT